MRKSFFNGNFPAKIDIMLVQRVNSGNSDLSAPPPSAVAPVQPPQPSSPGIGVSAQGGGGTTSFNRDTRKALLTNMGMSDGNADRVLNNPDIQAATPMMFCDGRLTEWDGIDMSTIVVIVFMNNNQPCTILVRENNPDLFEKCVCSLLGVAYSMVIYRMDITGCQWRQTYKQTQKAGNSLWKKMIKLFLEGGLTALIAGLLTFFTAVSGGDPIIGALLVMLIGFVIWGALNVVEAYANRT